MAKINFLVSHDLNQNELLRAILQNEASAPNSPTPKAGQLYYNTVDNKPYYFNGTTWIDFYGGIEEITADHGLKFTSGSGTDAVVHLSVDVDDSSLYIDPNSASGQVKIKPGGVLTTHIADLNVTTAKIEANAVTFAKMQDIDTMTIIGRVSAGSGDPEQITIVTTIDNEDDTVIPTEGAVFRYVNEQITSLGELVGDWDASGGAFPTVGSGSGGAVAKGDYWYITVAGTLGSGTVVNVGDVIYAKQNTPGQTDANWFVVESNRDQATESTLGVAKIATTAEAVAGTNDTNIMTPLKVQAKLNSWYVNNGTTVKEYTITGDGSTTFFTLTHNLANFNVQIEMTDPDENYETVYAEFTRPTNATVGIRVNTAIANLKEYRVIVSGKDKSIT